MSDKINHHIIDLKIDLFFAWFELKIDQSKEKKIGITSFYMLAAQLCKFTLFHIDKIFITINGENLKTVVITQRPPQMDFFDYGFGVGGGGGSSIHSVEIL